MCLDLDFSRKFSKLQYNSLAFVAGFKRATDEGTLPEIVQYSPYYLPLNILLLPEDQTFIAANRHAFIYRGL